MGWRPQYATARRRSSSIGCRVAIPTSPDPTDVACPVVLHEPLSEPGTYRPDIEGLRAVAVTFVVLFHIGFPGFAGGFIGVDVFFVISGFVITGLLLRERTRTGSTSLLDFYGRRARRILPAATLVILSATAAGYVLVGSGFGRQTANDGRWAAAFLVNVHFASPGPHPFSALGTFWSLSVEEQFYLAFPALLVVVASIRLGPGFRMRLSIGLAIVVVASCVLCVVRTPSHPVWAYLLPFTRAWEFAFGALIAAAPVPWSRIPRRGAAVATWIGLAVLVATESILKSTTGWPGWRAIVPVLATGLLIAGGSSASPFGAVAVLGRSPFRWLGKRSYSLYLWHWPVLLIAAEMGVSGGLWRLRVPLVALALVLSTLTYGLVENPIRRSTLSGARSVGIGVAITASTIGALSIVVAGHL